MTKDNPGRQVPPLPTTALRWCCPEDRFDFETTASVPPDGEVVGQDAALAALQFGIECRSKGQNVYVRGVTGTGRMTAVRQMLRDLAPTVEQKSDCCYVHNFAQPDRPRLIRLPAGQARAFRRRIKRLVECIRDELPKLLESEAAEARRGRIQEAAEAKVKAVSEPLQRELAQAGMTLVTVAQGQVGQSMLVPLIDGKPIGPQAYQQMIAEGKVTPEQQQAYDDAFPAFKKKIKAYNKELNKLYQEASELLRGANEELLREMLSALITTIKTDFADPGVERFLLEVADDAVENLLNGPEKPTDLDRRYGVNIVMEQSADRQAPVVEENSPTLPNLVGLVEPQWMGQGQMASSDYSGIRAGALLRADGGYLILDAKDLVGEQGAWRGLIRTLKTGLLEIVPSDVSLHLPYQVLKPEPIPVNVRVILIGNAMLHYQLEQLDWDFADLFKVLADFDVVMPRTPDALNQYARVVAGLTRDENLLPFTAAAVAALCEHGARIAASADKLTTRFGRIADIVRESSYLASKAAAASVDRDHVEDAVLRTKQRAMLSSSRFKELIQNGTIILRTQGAVVGQVNGLAVVSTGQLTYGFPARITATLSAGHAGLIDIEGRASMSGSIHTKGVNILGGLLRHLLRLDHPIAFSASLAFEQSYGGIDGDSASGAETCCLISALTNTPLTQELAITGAIDQHGHIQAIGGVNEKIEGFFDTCKLFGLNGARGVIIPKSNAKDLMLRADVVAAATEGRFQIYAVETIHEALALLTGKEVGELDDNGAYPEGSLLHCAQQQASKYWRETLKSPAALAREQSLPADEEAPDSDES